MGSTSDIRLRLGGNIQRSVIAKGGNNDDIRLVLERKPNLIDSWGSQVIEMAKTLRSLSFGLLFPFMTPGERHDVEEKFTLFDILDVGRYDKHLFARAMKFGDSELDALWRRRDQISLEQWPSYIRAFAAGSRPRIPIRGKRWMERTGDSLVPNNW